MSMQSAFLNPKIIAAHNSGLPRIRYDMLEADSQTFKYGDLVYSNSGAVTANASTNILTAGIALKDATNVTSGNVEIPILQIFPEDILAVYVTSGGTATSIAAYDHLDRKYGLYVGSNIGSLDVANTTNDFFILQGALDVTNHPYWARATVLASVCQSVVGY